MNDHAFRLYNPGRRGGGSVEMALWDLIGKAMGQPLYRIWAGAAAGIQTQPGLNRVMPYASQWTIGMPEERAREVQLIRSEGWKAMKLKLGLETVRQDVALTEAGRKAAGDDFLLTCDGNKAGPYGPSWPRYPWTFPRAVETARALAPLNLTWLEEPLRRFDYDQLAELNKMRLVPIAGGENDVGVNSFLTTLRTVGALTGAYDVQVAPHGGSGGVCWIGIMHLIASMPNAPMMELIHEPPHGPYSAFMDIFTDPPLMKEGYITVPDGPGLGVTIRPDLIIRS